MQFPRSFSFKVMFSQNADYTSKHNIETYKCAVYRFNFITTVTLTKLIFAGVCVCVCVCAVNVLVPTADVPIRLQTHIFTLAHEVMKGELGGHDYITYLFKL